eukprot:gene4206-5980_t
MSTDGPFLCFKELIPPSSVVLSTFFRSYFEDQTSQEYLMTLTCSTYNIYKLNSKSDDKDLSDDGICLAMHHRIFGEPKSLAVYTNETKQHHNGNEINVLEDMIVILFDYGKFVVLRFDPVLLLLENIYMCNAENNSIGLGAQLHANNHGLQSLKDYGAPTYVVVDSLNGIACSLLYGLQLHFVVLPFSKYLHKSDTSLHDGANQFIIDTRESFNLNCSSIIDIAFVNGYSNPVVAILQASSLVPIGHVAKVRHTCSVIVGAIDPIRKKAFQLWKVNNLPHDSISLIQLPSSSFFGCVGLVSLSSILVVSQEYVCGIATNGFASSTVSNRVRLEPWVNQEEGLELDGSHWIYDASNDFNLHNLIGCLKNGTIVRVGIQMAINGKLTHIKFEPEVLAISIMPSCFCSSFNGQYWFIGSRQADCLLFRVNRTVVNDLNGINNSNGNQTVTFLSPPSKKQRRLSDATPNKDINSNKNSEITVEELMLYAEESELSLSYSDLSVTSNFHSFYPKTKTAYPNGNIRYELMVIESVPVMGSVLHGLFTKSDDIFNNIFDIQEGRSYGSSSSNYSSQAAASFIPEKDQKDIFQISAGLDDSASLYRVLTGIQLSKISSKTFMGALTILSLNLIEILQFSILFVVFESKLRVIHCQDGISPALSTGGANKIVAPELRLFELVGEDSGFIVTDLTVNIGMIDEKSLLSIQIFSQGIRLVKLSVAFGGESEPLQDVLLLDSYELGGMNGSPGESIIFGDICEKWVYVLTNLHNAYVFMYDPDDEMISMKYAMQNPSSLTFQVIRDANNHVNGSNEQKDLSVLVSQSEIMEVEQSLSNNASSNSLYESLQGANNCKIITVSLFVGHIILETVNNHIFTSSNEIKKVDFEINDEKLLDVSIPILTREQEELLLYGSVLINEEKNEYDMDISNNHNNSNNNNNNSNNEPTFTPNDISVDENDSYAITSDVLGFLSIVRLKDNKLIINTDKFHLLSNAIISSDLMMSPNTFSVTKDDSDYRLIIETKLVRLNHKSTSNDMNVPSSHDNKSKLCLILLFHTGDMAVYYANERNNKIVSFIKSDYFPINNKRSFSKSLFRRSTTSDVMYDEMHRSSSNVNNNNDIMSYLSSAEYANRTGYIFQYTKEFNNRNGILVSSNVPLIISNSFGLPHIIQLGLPELPYTNYGCYVTVPLSINTARAIATLWLEYEDSDSSKFNKMSNNIMNRSNRASTLGIYQELPGMSTFPGSSIALKRINAHRTVHKFLEIHKKTDDRTEQALLDKKTFLMSCSEWKYEPFIPTVLTEEETATEDILYERYLTNLESFAQPTTSKHGKPPPFVTRTHQLSLIQSGVCVDTYSLPSLENVLDIDILYFPVEKTVTIVTGVVNGVPTNSTVKQLESRVFVVACTSISEKRGEDTQGAGRLILFGIDYALFDEIDNETSGHSHGTAESKADGNNIDKVNNDNSSGNNKASSAQSRFLDSIQPKLKLLWSGPGPCSIVRQLGERYVLTTVGPTLFVYKLNFDTMELDQISFYFTKFYISSVSIMKNYILVADMLNSVLFLYWREEDYSINFIAKDYDQGVCLTTGFIYDGSKLGMLVGDDEKNVQLLQENPRKLESVTGTRLLCIADFHLGSDASAIVSHDALSADLKKIIIRAPNDNRPPPPPPRTRKGSSFPLQSFSTRFNKNSNITKSCAIVGTIDGGLGVFIPIDEKMYHRLALLQQIMSLSIPTPFGLNPRQYRVFKSSNRLHRFQRQKGILDGNILWMFSSLDPKMQEELAESLGVTAYLIKENLRELESVIQFF